MKNYSACRGGSKLGDMKSQSPCIPLAFPYAGTCADSLFNFWRGIIYELFNLSHCAGRNVCHFSEFFLCVDWLYSLSFCIKVYQI